MSVTGCMICINLDGSHEEVADGFRAMENFAPSEPLFTVLKNLHKQHMAAEAQAASQIQAGANGSAPAAAMTDDAKCAFCLDHCGLAVRQCVEARGGRRALKEMIRKLNEGQSDDADEQARLDALFACYQAVRLSPENH